jgi:hypothetical protein
LTNSLALYVFLLYVVHQVEPPPSFSSWADSLHLCLTSTSNNDPSFSLLPWWAMDCIP